MKKLKLNLVALLISMCFTSSVVYSIEDIPWKNDLRTKFLNNETVIMEVNIRSFNSLDKDGDGFIQEEKGEVRGTFLNAIDRLDELKNLGINTLHVLPITSVGKYKAIGTAGSLYSAADFRTLNEDLYDKNSPLTLDEQAKKFIDEAHKRNIRVIIDIPACGSYDLFLQRPDLFVTTQNKEPVVPSDWTDVRLLAVGTEDKIDSNVYSLYKEFLKKMINMGVDGIRADVAHSKTAAFWKELINYSRKKDENFLWIAEVSDSWSEPVSEYAPFTSYDKLLDAGFDGYYGSFFNLKNWTLAKDLHKQILFNLDSTKKFKENKSLIGAFTTHDEVSPILLKGENFSTMMIWLNSTLPINSYYVDGFQTGDDYSYKMGNKTAPNSNTDDDIYFTHRGKIDIFNLSRKPGGNNQEIKRNFLLGNDIKNSVLPILNNGSYTILKTKNSRVFAYSFTYNKKTVVTIGNLNFNANEKAVIKIGKQSKILPIKISQMPEISKNGKIILNLHPGEIVVLIANQ